LETKAEAKFTFSAFSPPVPISGRPPKGIWERQHHPA